MVLLKAYPIYPQTKRFPLVWAMRDDDSTNPDIVIAYGVRLTKAQPTSNRCYICDGVGCDMKTEHGAMGSPPDGVPAHLACQMKGEGFLISTENVKLIDPIEDFRDQFTPSGWELLTQAVGGYRATCRWLVETFPSQTNQKSLLPQWESLCRQLGID